MDTFIGMTRTTRTRTDMVVYYQVEASEKTPASTIVAGL